MEGSEQEAYKLEFADCKISIYVFELEALHKTYLGAMIVQIIRWYRYRLNCGFE